MRKLITLFSLLLLLKPGFAQKAGQLEVEKKFSSYEYAAAAKLYEEIVEENNTDVNSLQKLILSYKYQNDTKNAERWLSVLCNQSGTEAAFLKLYAQMLASNGNYTEALEWYIKYDSLQNDQETKKIIAAYGNMKGFYRDSSFYKIENVSFNSPESDFSPQFYKDGIMFCSSRKIDGMEYKWNQSFFVDIYLQHNNSSATPENVGSPINSSLHEGPVAFTASNDTIYFTRNIFLNNRDTEKSPVNRLKICYSVNNNGTWGKVQDILLTDKQFSAGHPALASGNKLYFVSDMPGGHGGKDIYFSKKENGIWGKPQNAGSAINTSGDEMFPFLDNSGNLYFASNGHPGLGGLDIFKAAFSSEEFYKPANVGFPINSSKDDFGFIIQNNKGYFTSNRGENYKDDNIFSFSIDKSKILNVIAKSEQGTNLNQFTVSINTAGKQATVEEVNNKYSGNFICETEYTITCSAKGYIDKQKELSIEELIALKNNATIEMVLNEAKRTVLLDVASPDGKRLNGSTLTVRNLSNNENSGYTVTTEPATIVLSTSVDYEITANHKGHKQKSITLGATDILQMANNDGVALTLPTINALFDTHKIGEEVELEIRYDVNKATIRKDAAKELDKLVVFLKKYPNIKVELGSHTDSRGSDDANFTLSQKRAESAVKYIVTKGISGKQLMPIGYGENDPKVADATTDDDHQQNRRTTVKIVGL